MVCMDEAMSITKQQQQQPFTPENKHSSVVCVAKMLLLTTTYRSQRYTVPTKEEE